MPEATTEVGAWRPTEMGTQTNAERGERSRITARTVSRRIRHVYHSDTFTIDDINMGMPIETDEIWKISNQRADERTVIRRLLSTLQTAKENAAANIESRHKAMIDCDVLNTSKYPDVDESVTWASDITTTEGVMQCMLPIPNVY